MILLFLLYYKFLNSFNEYNSITMLSISGCTKIRKTTDSLSKMLKTYISYKDLFLSVAIYSLVKYLNTY